MSKLDKRQRLDLLGLVPQRPGAPAGVVKLDEDESPRDWPAPLKEEWSRRFGALDWSRYPAGQLELKRALSEPLGLTDAWISLGAGSGEVIRHLLMAWCLRGTVVYPVPTRGDYGLIAQTLAIKHVAVMLRADFMLPLDQLTAIAHAQDANVVLIGNPNNPTGNLFTRDELLTVARETDALVVVDEAYIEYSGLSLADAVVEHENLAVVRSFSHAWGAAGFRLGYLLAHPRVVTELEKVRLPHNVSAPALAAGLFAIEHADVWHAAARDVVNAREALRHALTAVRGVVTWPSAANFVLVGTTLKGAELARRLAGEGILVRPFSRSPLLNCVRVTVGSPEAHTALVAALLEIFGPAEAPA